MSATCPDCNEEVPQDRSFCPECGQAMQEQSAGGVVPSMDGHSYVPYIPKKDENIGRVLAGQYELTNIICRNMYAARDLINSCEVTVQLVSSGFTPQEEVLETFEAKRRKFSQIVHPHIAQIQSTGIDGQHLFLAFDAIADCTFETFQMPYSVSDISTETFRAFPRATSLADIRQVIFETLSGLEAMHRNDLVHGHLHSSTILLARTNDPQVFQTRLCAYAHTDSAAMRPPECFHYADDRLTPAADIWSMSALIGSSAGHLFEHLPGLEAAVKIGSNHSWEKRQPDASAFRQDLEGLAQADLSSEPIVNDFHHYR